MGEFVNNHGSASLDDQNMTSPYLVQMNHKINHISFGEKKYQEEILKSDFAKVDDGAHTMFNMFGLKDGKVNDDLKTSLEKEV